jgi:NitT/TauT family transport system substrate-binding protein
VYVVPALDSAGFFVALYDGLFKAQGLNVHFTPATSSETVIADQVKGQFDITLGNYVSYIQAQQRRAADLYVFAEASVMGPATQGIYTMPDSKVTDLSGLVGKTIAINAPKNILYLLAASVLAEHGIRPSLVHFASVPFPNMTAALQSGAVGAALLPEPFASGAEEARGVVPLADLNGVSRQTAAVLALDSYPFSPGPVGSVDKIRLQRVVNVMQQFIGFPKFNIDTMIMPPRLT